MRCDMPVFMHANSVEAHAFALASGVDSTAHGIWNGLPDGEAQLFRALTLSNAEAIGLANDIGTIAVGRLANLLLLSENRSRTSRPMIRLKRFIAGRPIAREELSARSAP